MKKVEEFKEVYKYNDGVSGPKILTMKFLTKIDENLNPISTDLYVRTSLSGEKYIKLDDEERKQILYDEEWNEEKRKSEEQAINDIKTRHLTNKVEIGTRYTDRKDEDYDEDELGRYVFPQPRYVYCRSKNLKLPMTEIQISRIKYDTKTKTFYGIEQEPSIDDPKNFHPKYINLKQSWIKENFTPNQINFFKEEAERGNSRFLSVPLGDKIEIKPTMDISSNPLILYQNNESAICAFASFASVLHYLEFYNEARRLMEFCHEFYEKKENFHRILGQIVKFVLGDSVFKASFNKLYQPQKVKRGFLPYNMNDHDLKSIFLVCLHQDDNHTSHAVSVADNLIFDCNATNALPLTKEGLDCCCGENASFRYFYGGYKFVLRNKI
jgi:hypothetical protein